MARVLSVMREAMEAGSLFPSAPRADIQRRQREVQPRRARVHRQRVRNIGISAELSLELSGPGAGGEPAGFKRANHFIDFFVSNAGTVIGYLNIRLHKKLLRVINERVRLNAGPLRGT